MDSQMGTMSYTVTIVATQKRAGIHTSTIGDANVGDIVLYNDSTNDDNKSKGIVIGKAIDGNNKEIGYCIIWCVDNKNTHYIDKVQYLI